MTVRCAGCGADNPATARWCGRCGAALDEDVPPGEAPSAPHGADRQREPGSTRTSGRGVAAGLLVALAVLIGVEMWLGGTGPGRGAGPVELPSPRPSAAPDAATSRPASSLPSCQIGPTMTVPVIGSPCRRWSAERPADDRGWLVSDGDLYLTDGRGFVESRTLADGVQRWAARPGGATQLRAVEQETVYVTVNDRQLLALARSDGTPRWNHRIDPASQELPGAGETIRRVLATTSNVYLQVGATLVALDVDDGSVGWTWSQQHVLSAGTSGDRPYVVVVDGVVGLGPSDGTSRWRVPRVTFDTRPHVASDDDVLIGDDDSHVSLIATETGQVRWTRELGALPVSIATAGGHVTVQGRLGRVWNLARHDGGVRWAVGATPEALQLLEVGPKVVVASAGSRSHVVAVDAASGRERWRRAVTGLEDAHLREDEVVIDADGQILAVDVRDGTDRWSLRLSGRVLRAAPDPLLVATAGALVAIDPPVEVP